MCLDCQSHIFLFVFVPPTVTEAVRSSARVGLTLKRANASEPWLQCFAAPYRFFLRNGLKNGKVNAVVTALLAGGDVDAVVALCGSKRDSVDAWKRVIDGLAPGFDAAKYYGKGLDGTEDLVRALAASAKAFASWA